jgi:hypothetical protein
MLVEVRPISERQPAYLREQLKPEESFARAVGIEAMLDYRNSIYITGLNEEDQKKYGDLLGVSLDNKMLFENGKPIGHPYYHSRLGRVKLENYTMVFDTTNPKDYVTVALLKAHPSVANSKELIDLNLNATHYIYSEEEEVQKKASVLELRKKCILASAALTPNKKRAIVLVLSGTSCSGKNDDYVEVMIDSLITNKPIDFLKILEMNDEELNIRGVILEALRKNILNREGLTITYMGNIIADDYESCVRWFMNVDNQKTKIHILEKLQNS